MSIKDQCKKARYLTGREEEHVLNEACEHVPGLKVHERADDEQSVGGCQGYTDVLQSGGICNYPERTSNAIQQRKSERIILREVLPAFEAVWHCEVYCPACTPYCDDVAKTKQHDSNNVGPL
jgi:hypothetical protein